MFLKTKAKSFALGLTLVLALTAAPPALAGPNLGGDLGDAVYGFFAEIWHSVSSVIGTQDEYGAYIIPNGDPAEFSGTGVIPNGSSSDAGAEYGPWVIPNGSSSDSGAEFGPWVIPNGSSSGHSTSEFGPWAIPDELEEEADLDDEFGPGQIPNG